MFNDISGATKDKEKECLANAKLVSLYARRFPKGQWSFVGLGSEKKWYKTVEIVHKESGTQLPKNVGRIGRKRMNDFPYYEPIVQRST